MVVVHALSRELASNHQKENSMKTIARIGGLLLFIGALLPIGLPAAQSNAATGTVTMTVTAAGKKGRTPPAITRDDVQVYQSKEKLQVADWKRGETLYLAVLIDDSIDTSAAANWNDLKAFMNAQPATTSIAVAYARNGAATIAQDFTADHSKAAKALRLPVGGQGAFSSPYLAMQDLIKRWPASGDRRSIILISSGIDYFRGNFGPTSPDLDFTIELAQKGNINIWTIYYPGAGHTSRGFFRVSNAQSNLSQLSDETGAESYFLGVSAPVSFKSYFDEIQAHLSNQYLLTFPASGGKKGRFDRVRVATELPRVEFMAPSAVFLPASQ
jgi:hypothetical protein